MYKEAWVKNAWLYKVLLRRNVLKDNADLCKARQTAPPQLFP